MLYEFLLCYMFIFCYFFIKIESIKIFFLSKLEFINIKFVGFFSLKKIFFNYVWLK